MRHLNLTARHVSRGIMQWDDSEKVGFTDGLSWTLYNRESKYNVEDQEKDENSILHFYRKLIELKKTALFQKGAYEMLETKDTLYVYRRTLDEKEALVCCNFSEEADTIEIAEEWTSGHIVLENDGNSLEGGRLLLPPYGAAVFIKDE